MILRTLHFQRLIIIFFLCCAHSVISQNINLDSIYYKKCQEYRYSNPDSVLYYSDKLNASKNTCLKFRGRVYATMAHYDRGDYKASEQTCLAILDSLQSVTDANICFTEIKYESLGRLFWIKKNTGKLEEALKLLIEKQQVLTSYDKTQEGYVKRVLIDKYNMALIKKALGLNDEAISILKDTDRIYEGFGDIVLLKRNKSMLLNASSALNTLGDIYLESSKKSSKYLDSARSSYTKAYNVARKFNPPHENTETLYQLRLATVLIKEEEFSNALDLVNRYSKNQKLYNSTQNINYLKAIIFYNLNQADSSIHYCSNFLSYERQTASTESNKIAILNILAEAYKSVQKIDSAYKYSALAMDELNDLNQKRSEANNSNYLYDFNKVRTLNKRILFQEKEKKNRLIFFFCLIATSLLIVTYYMYRKRKKQTNLLDDIKHQVSPIKKEYSINEGLENEIMAKLLKFENSHAYLDQRLSLQTLAKSFNTNSSYLSSIINEKKGKHFKQYIGELRIDYLVETLKSTPKLREYTIQALAQEVGYTNASSFTRAFKKHIGMTPSDFLKSLED